MNLPEIIWDICQECDPCQAQLVCKMHAIVRLDPDSPPHIEYSRCNRCGVCAKACSSLAIRLPGAQFKILK